MTVEETVEPKPAPRRRVSRARVTPEAAVEEPAQGDGVGAIAVAEAPQEVAEAPPAKPAASRSSRSRAASKAIVADEITPAPEPTPTVEVPSATVAPELPIAAEATPIAPPIAPPIPPPTPPVEDAAPQVERSAEPQSAPSLTAPENLTPEAIGEFLLDPRSEFGTRSRSRDSRRGRDRNATSRPPTPERGSNGAERNTPDGRDNRYPSYQQPRPRNGATYQQPQSQPQPQQQQQRSGPPHITIAELDAKTPEELAEMARELEIPTFQRLPRPEQMVRLLRAQTEKDGQIFGDGILEIIEDGFGFLRGPRFLPGPDDIYVSQSQIRRFGLRTGDRVSGQVRPPKDNEKFFSLLRVEAVNGIDPETARRRPSFDTLTPIFPLELVNLETAPNILSTRLLNLVAPIGRGQRGLIVSPPKAGKTMLLKSIANGISTNCPDIHLMVCLIGERPEEVTDMRRSIEGEVISSTFDEPVEDHTKVAEMALERAKRLVEGGRDVVILLDSITRLARAYNLAVPPSGRTLSGGIDPVALYPPKRFFGAARNIEGGGSLTIVSTCLIDTGSRMDDVIYEEFKGTGNMELHLDRKLAERRIYPSIDIQRSGTRREELLLDESTLRQVWTMRRMVSMLGGSEGTELVLGRLAKTQSNQEFLETLNRDI
ncbi:MAG: transcription termination factor Rho [Thermomicrobiales bacterium]